MPNINIKNFLRSGAAALVSLFLFFGIAGVAAATAGINKQINFQGKVVNKTVGTNVPTASYNFLFCIYTTATPVTPCTAGSNNDAVWKESKSLTVTDGIFQTNLGDTTTLPGAIDFNTDNIYLGINFNSNGEMSPLVRFTAAPYAMNAEKVGGLGTTDLIVKAATANQTVTSSQTTGTVYGVTDTTGLSAAIKGLGITLSGAGAFDQTGLEFSLSGASGTNLNDIVGSGSTWKVSTGGAATFASVGAGSGTITTSGTIGTASTTTFTGAGATFSSAVAANGGITFDQSTDTLGAHTLGGTLATGTQNITGTNFTITGSTGVIALKGGAAAGDLTTMSTAAGTTLNILPSNPSSTGAGVGLVLKGSAGTTTGAGGAVTITAGAAAGAGTTGGTVAITTGAGGASGTAPSGALTLVTGNATSGTAGTVSIDTGTSSTGTGAVSIGTAARAQTISIGNNATAGTVTTIGSLTNTGLILQDAQWNVTDAGAATFASVGAGSGTITTSGTIGTASTTTFTGAGATFSSAVAANGGITLDAGTDTISAFTAGGTISMGAQALNGTTGVINYTGFDVDASGNLDALGTITAGSGNIQVTDANGKVQHDSIVDCTDTQILKWATAGGWGCAADATGAGGGTLQSAYDTASGNTILTTTARNIAFTLGEVATPTSFTLENQDTAGVSAERIFNSIASLTLTNGLLIEQTGAGTMTNGLQVLGTAGAISNALLIADGAGTIDKGIVMTGTITTAILDTPSIDISGTGAITGATGVSTTTVTASSAIAANGGITFDASTDTIGAFTAGGTISMGAQALNGTTGVINYTGFDVDASGNLDALGTITAGSVNIALTDASGNILHDALVACADTQILKYATATAWGCAADNNSGGATAWDAIGDPAGNGAISMGTTTQTMDWSFSTTAANYLTYNFLNNGGTAGADNGLVINNAVSTASGAVDLNTENLLLIQQLDTTATGTTTVDNAIHIDAVGSSPLTNGLSITNTGASSAITSAINIADTTGTIATGITMSGTFTNLIDTPNFDVNNAGGITVAAAEGLDTNAAGALELGKANATSVDICNSANCDTINIGNLASTDADTIIIGDALDDVAITDANWSITGAGALTVTSCTGCGGATTKYLTANHANSTTTGTKVTSLDTTLAPGTYTFKYSLIMQSATTSVGPMFGINFSTGTAAVHTFAMRWADTSTALTAYADGMDDEGAKGLGVIAGMASKTFSNTAPNLGTTVGVSATGVNIPAWIDGILVVTVQGALELWHSSETNSATTLMANSSLIVQPITAGADLAEMYGTKDTTIGAGDVVSLDSSMNAGVKKSEKAYDSNTFGIISTSPSLSMGTLDDAGATPVMVAFSGRVPVKVNTENGPIKFGDLLTASSTPGVAMRATKAGQVIGQAMSEFNGTGVGKVMAFIKTDYSNGAKLADILPAGLAVTGSAAPVVPNNQSKQALQYFVEHKEALAAATDLSEITTDRLMAGLEIITPKVTTQELATDTIQPSLTKTLSVEFGPDGAVTFGEPGKVPTSRIDALGNATFAGVVTAKTIRADSIEGLEIYTDSVKSLEEKYAGLVPSSFVAVPPVTAGITTLPVTSEPASATTLSQTLQTFQVENLAVTLDASILGKLTVSGALTLAGPAEFQGETVFRKLVTFFGDALFKGKVAFEKAPTFSANTAGFAVISEGQKSVDIVFDEKYAKQPIVSISLTNDQNPLLDGADKSLQKDIQAVEDDLTAAYFASDIKYLVTKKSENGFTILLSKAAPREFQFSWVALAVSDAKVSRSKDAVVDTASASTAETQTDMTPEAIVPSQGEISPVPVEAPIVSPVDATPVVPSTIDQTRAEDTSSGVSDASQAVETNVPVTETLPPDVAPITDSLSQLTNSLGQ